MTELNEEKIEGLLDEFMQQRNQLNVMIDEIKDIKEKADALIPQPDPDFRNFKRGSRSASIFEERVKSITEFFRLILDMRREISKTLKDEIELRRKVSSGKELDIDQLLDVSKLADKVESLEKKKEKLKK